jgi:hypothetical protein
MARRTRFVAAGTVLLALLMPSAALAADPGTVTLRVEGDADTLLVRTTVPASGPAVVRDGNSCPGDSAAAVLDRATTGSWKGTWNAGFSDWELTTIKGESHSFSAAAYWGFFLNDAVASAGICTQKVQAGDRLLFAPAPSNFDPVGVLTLDGVPATAAPGTPFTVTVKRTATAYGGPPDYAAITETLPLAGATITLPGGATATTAADGTAAITLTAGGSGSLRATHAGDVRSAAEPVCVTTGGDGLCGSAAPAGTTGAALPGAPRDVTPALPRIGLIAEAARFSRRSAPRTLSGTVAVDASGLKDVLLRITRRSGRRCEAYDGGSERWVRSSPCGTEGGRFFSIGSRADWSYLLPGALTAGRYVLDIRTVDGAGNVTRGADRGSDPSRPRTRVVFTVG